MQRRTHSTGLKRPVLAVVLLTAAVTAAGCAKARSYDRLYGRDRPADTAELATSSAPDPVVRAVIDSPTGRTYRVTGAGDVRTIDAFEEHGMVATGGDADVLVELDVGDLRPCEPSAMRTDLGFVPAFAIILPYTVTIRQGDNVMAQNVDKYTRLFRFDGNAAFPTREAAVDAIRAVRDLAQNELEQLARGEALRQARATLADTASRVVQHGNTAAAPTR